MTSKAMQTLDAMINANTDKYRKFFTMEFTSRVGKIVQDQICDQLQYVNAIIVEINS